DHLRAEEAAGRLRQLPRRALRRRRGLGVRRRRVRHLHDRAAAPGVPRRVHHVTGGRVMALKVVLVDVNPKMIAAFRTSFEATPGVDVVPGSMLDQAVDAWVSPTNSRGVMGGGLDAVIKKFLGAQVEQRVQAEIGRLYNGRMPVGCAVCVPSGGMRPRYLIS